MILVSPKNNPLLRFLRKPPTRFQGVLFCIPHPMTWRWLFSFLGSVDDAIRATCHGFHGCVHPCPPKSNVWLRMVKVCTVWVEVGYTRWGPPDNKQHDWKQFVSNRSGFKLWLLGKGPSNLSLSLSLWGPKFGTPKWDGLLLKKKQHLQFLAQFWPILILKSNWDEWAWSFHNAWDFLPYLKHS